MRLSRIFGIFLAVLMILSFASISLSQEKQAVLNTRGACLKAHDFVALMKSEVKGMKAGQPLKLIIDTMNEPEAKDAIKQAGYTIMETTQDKDKGSTTYILKVK